jgi:plasmid maintenance system antidote protein VapI
MVKTINDKEMEIHFGQLIKEEFNRQGRRAMWLAAELNCNRSNVYSIFSRENIDAKMLIKISQALDHNFFQDVANLLDNKKCLTSDDKGSENLIQNVQNLDTEKIGD